jgi:hypothetical protein
MCFGGMMKDVTQPIDQEHSCQQLSTLRMNYEFGVPGKVDYNSETWKIHQRIFEYQGD